jgi:hypothetical protein
MTSRNKLRTMRTKTPITAPKRALPSTGSVRRRPSVFEIVSSRTAPQRATKVDWWSLILAAAVPGLLAVALVSYVLFPALSTLTDASVITWTGEGP